MRLWRSTSGDPSTWEEVARFPDCGIWQDLPFETHKGALYVMSDFIWRDGAFAPAEMWRSFDGKNWEPVITDGFGDPANLRSGGFGQRGGYLYASMGEAPGIGNIYRSKDGLIWEPITTDGFGDPVIGFMFASYRDQLLA